MPLTFNLRHVERGEVHLKGEVTAEELALNDVDELIEMSQPLRYDLNVDRVGNNLLVQGKLESTLACECVRCLKKFDYPLALEAWTCELPLEGEEKVSIHNDVVDLTPYVRDDILLAFPQHPLCEQGCRGLLDAVHNRPEPSGVEERASETSSAWSELNKLKF